MIREGCVESIKYRSEDTGYTVFDLAVTGEKELVTCVGSFSFLAEGEYVRLEGADTKHPLYGDQFKVVKCEISEPKDETAMEMYLSSGAIKGIGKTLATRIVAAFKDETFTVIEQEPERLADIKGISERMAREISAQFEEKREQRQSVLFLQQYGISANLSVKIQKQYGDRMYDIIRTNPYRLAEDISGVGFKTVDEIAARVGIEPNSDYRVRAGVLFTLSEASGAGHTYLPEDILVRNASALLLADEDDVRRQIDKLILERSLMCTRDEDEKLCIYSAPVYYMELNTARMLTDLNVFCGVVEAAVEKRVSSIEKSMEVSLDELQRKAVLEAARNGVFVLTGGPGTGKTTTINAIIRFFESEGLDILLAAPTGRAAKRIFETTGREASTIHRLLELRGGAGLNDEKGGSRSFTFERNESNPLEADVVIIDEMSMVDIYLMHALLKAVTIGTRLILVGDVNQLPSVGPGNVLRDIIDSGQFNVIRLNRIFRQAAQSDIVMNAHRINRGEEITLDNKSRDFFFMARTEAEEIQGLLVALVRDKLPKFVNAEPYDIQVLTPMKKGELGVERLNTVLQHYLNPPSAAKAEKEHHGSIFRVGDKVMQIKNNYQAEWEIRNRHGYLIDSGTGIFNGDCGIIRDINMYSETLQIEFDEGRMVDYPFSQLEELELAYAVTIHKSQGSEYPAVVLPLLTGPAMLFSRNLLYTAVTRAKSCVTIVGSAQTVNGMIKNNNEMKRYSGLAAHIREMK